MTLPTPPAQQRSWITRGFYHPPRQGVSVPQMLLNTAITLLRENRIPDGKGNFAGQGYLPYIQPTTATDGSLIPNAYVEIQPDDKGLIRGAVVEAVGVLQLRHYQVVIGWPGSPDTVPVKGDRLEFTDMKGQFVSILIDKVEAPLGLADHIEFTSELFE